MPDSATIQITGLKEMLGTLHALSAVTQTKLAYRATAKAARKVMRSAQANIQSYELIDTGAMIGNVAIARQKPDGLIYSYDIGVRHGSKKQIKADDDPWYWFIQEFGSVKLEGKHFMTQAFADDRAGSLEAMRSSLAAGIEIETKKLSKA